jgi:hypothetical protein
VKRPVEPWVNGVKPFGAICGRETSRAHRDALRFRRQSLRRSLLVAGLSGGTAGALMALLMAYVEWRLFGA